MILLEDVVTFVRDFAPIVSEPIFNPSNEALLLSPTNVIGPELASTLPLRPAPRL